MAISEHDLLLITGIPGSGKTTYGKRLERDFGFVHCDLETPQRLNRLGIHPAGYIDELKGRDQNVVVTWGFVPDELQTGIVSQFRNAGFRLIWFDGNRPAALREFQKRGTVPEESFYAQMYRIENFKIVQRLRPMMIN